MANLNKVLLIGRLTRDPEVRTFPSGGKVANFGFAVNNRRKNTATGQWEDEPVFIDVEAFNGLEGRRQLADLVEQYLHKGNQAFIEGHLRLDQWNAPDGQKRSKLKVRLDNLQFLEPRSDAGSSGYQRSAPAGRPAMSAPRGGSEEAYPSEPEPMATNPQTDDEIPF
jgi:single-strand DNA-binding protein